jgi:putative ABC transport system permease protein
MLAITLQDLRYRARRFVIAAIGASLVFAMTLLLAGLAAGFKVEIDKTVKALGATSWVVADGSAGRIVALSPFVAPPDDQLVNARRGDRTGPIVIAPQAADVHGAQKSVVAIGFVPGKVGTPPLHSGRQVRKDGEAVVDSRLHLGARDRFSMSGRDFTVVGTTSGLTLLGGSPNAYITLTDAQATAFGGRPLVSAVLIRGTPTDVLPRGVALYTNHRIQHDSLVQMASAVSSIANTRVLMWVIAAVIVAALVYVSALERSRDFAVLKALGASSAVLYLGLAVQATLVSLVAAALGGVLANFMRGIFAQPVAIPTSAVVLLPISALLIGLLASLAALRRAVSVDPATAFAGP